MHMDYTRVSHWTEVIHVVCVSIPFSKTKKYIFSFSKWIVFPAYTQIFWQISKCVVYTVSIVCKHKHNIVIEYLENTFFIFILNKQIDKLHVLFNVKLRFRTFFLAINFFRLNKNTWKLFNRNTIFRLV